MLNIITSRWLSVCVGLTLVGFITADCPFPLRDREHLLFRYQSPRDALRINAPEGYLLRFFCAPEYYRIGPSEIVCHKDEWSSVVPVCFRRECNKPPTIQNGTFKLSSEEAVIGSSAFYRCKRGYELTNYSHSSLKCVYDPEEEEAIWEGEFPVCKEKAICPDPAKSDDGDLKGNCCYSGDILQFSCNEGYERVGSEYIKCLTSGEWNSSRPLCKPTEEIVCERPPVIPHGLVTGDKEGDYFRPDEEAEVLCEPGYFVNGSAKYILCEENGVWEKEFGECEAILCDPPEPLENGTIPEVAATNVTAFPYNFEITYECDKGYRLVGGDSWRFCGKNGWSGETPHCEEILCPDPGSPEHGSREGHSFKIGEKVIFSCFSGYELLGSFERYCMPNGQWTGELARCDTESNYCPDPGIPINGFKNTSNYNMGERVGFQCRSGYTLVGSEVRECLHDETWSGKEARCIGPYDYDNNAQVRDRLKVSVARKAEEQEKELREYLSKVVNNRNLNLNDPRRFMLYFIFDASGSVGPHNFQKSIDFAKAIIKKVGITPNSARAGAITFSSKAEISIIPLDQKSTEEVLAAFDEIKYTGGGSSASSALLQVRQELMPFTENKYGKKEIKHVVFLLTDGKANMGGDPQVEAAILKEAGVEIYCIGITGDIRKETLYKIASDPVEEHVFILDSYSSLSWIIQEITNGTIDYSQCGMGMENADVKIPRARMVGGKNAAKPWPWMAALYMLPRGSVDLKEAKLMCGASIIHEKFILTAAHCLYEKENIMLRDKTKVLIKLGLTDVKNETHVQEPDIDKIIVHPKYRVGRYDFDIALLRLKGSIEFNEHVRPVCLPPAELPKESTLYKAKEFGMVTGWGHDGIVRPGENIQQGTVRHLKQLRLPIRKDSVCAKSLKDIKDEGTFTDRMFCAGYPQEGNDTCQGDSGGPFMQPQLNSEGYIYWTQVGIVSWGTGCGVANTYGFYTHVHQLSSWIKFNIEEALKEDVAEV